MIHVLRLGVQLRYLENTDTASDALREEEEEDCGRKTLCMYRMLVPYAYDFLRGV